MFSLKDERYFGKGSTNGYFRGQLFACRRDDGLFVALDKLALSPDSGATRQTPAPPLTEAGSSGSRLGLKPKDVSNSPDRKSSGPAGSTRSQVHTPPPIRFRSGDRVVVYNKNQNAFHGTVRWTGQTNTGSERCNAVGIETVSNCCFTCEFL